MVSDGAADVNLFVALACYAYGSAAEGRTVEAPDILLLGHSGSDRQGGRRRGRTGPSVSTKWGGLWFEEELALLRVFFVRRAPYVDWATQSQERKPSQLQVYPYL